MAILASTSLSFLFLRSRFSYSTPSHRAPNHKSRLRRGGGGEEATTFTCLPPKDDFYQNSSIHLSQQITLGDVTSVNPIRPDECPEEIADDEEVWGSGDQVFHVHDEDSIFIQPEEEWQEHGEEEHDVQCKDKGVPAIMRCFDRTRIFVKAGDGGNGAVAFRREKFVPFGGPSGGDGGRGGNIIVEVDGAMNSLLPFRKNLHFRGEKGGNGRGKKQGGARGEDVIVKVAPGTVIREAIKGGVDGDVLLDLLHPGQRACLLPGGRGGRGNASFKSGFNRVPRIAENGEEGPEMWLDLELKLVADVGIVGAPNAGKSTLLSAISAAEPNIANYPFTTLLPNLGVVSMDFDATMVVADLPGLLEGAHQGYGLGHEFLRHAERCSVLVCNIFHSYTVFTMYLLLLLFLLRAAIY